MTEIQCLSTTDADVRMSNALYDFYATNHFWYQWRFHVLCSLNDKFETGARVLEVGCGNAIARRQFEQRFGIAIDGCDLNSFALKQAIPGDGNLYLYDVHDRRPEWEGFFDCILLLDTLEHIEQPVEFLQSVAYHLRPGGKLLLNVPAMQFLFSRYDEVLGHVKRYRRKILSFELTRAGFTVQKTSYWGLTMIPVLALRKVVLWFTPRDRIASAGFQPGRFADFFLRALMLGERKLLRRPVIGASLSAVAIKPDVEPSADQD